MFTYICAACSFPFVIAAALWATHRRQRHTRPWELRALGQFYAAYPSHIGAGLGHIGAGLGHIGAGLGHIGA